MKEGRKLLTFVIEISDRIYLLLMGCPLCCAQECDYITLNF